MSDIKFSNRILRRFVETVALELGADQFNAMLALARLPAEWAKPGTFARTDADIKFFLSLNLISVPVTFPE